MTAANILKEDRDRDSLGGRIARARIAIDLDLQEAAERVGVTHETYENWELDRDEPRANRLAMLAGCLSVSPTWLLYGIGEAPISESTNEEIVHLKDQMIRVQALSDQLADAVQQLDSAIGRLSVHSDD